jgi:hypothetical protein
MLNDNIMDFAMASLCSLLNNSGTCSTSAWWSESKSMDSCIGEIRMNGQKKIVLAVVSMAIGSVSSWTPLSLER